MRIKHPRKFVEVLRDQARAIWKAADSLERHFVSNGMIEPEDAPKPDYSEVVKANLYAVERILESRRKRDQCLPPEVFGEPGWELLLNLYREAALGREITITKASYSGGCPPSTALRMIDTLQQFGLVEKHKSNKSRKVVVRISAVGIEGLNRYFGKVADNVPSLFTIPEDGFSHEDQSFNSYGMLI